MLKNVVIWIMIVGATLLLWSCSEEEENSLIGYYETNNNDELIIKENNRFTFIVNNALYAFGEYETTGNNIAFYDSIKSLSFGGYIYDGNMIRITISIITYNLVYAENQNKTNTITFDTFDEYNIEPITVKHGYCLPVPDDLEHETDTFLGWSSSASQTVRYYFNTPVIRDLILYPVWDVKRCIVTYETNIEYKLPRAIVRENEKLPLPNVLSETGYDFAGWYTDATLTKLYNFNNIVKSSFVLYAKWETKRLNVSYHTNTDEVVESIKVDYGNKISEVALVAPEGYTFVGWYTDSYYTNLYNFDNPVIANLELYAKWEIDLYRIKFESNTETEVFDAIVEHGKTLLDLPNIEKDNYTLEGWYLDSQFTIPFDIAVPVTSNLTLYAKWDIVKYTVTIHTNTDEVIEPIEVPVKSTLTYFEPNNIIGYDFGGWYTDSYYTNLYNFDNPVFADFDLYAKWNIKILNVSFVTNIDLELSSQNIAYGSLANHPALPLVPNMTFTGWYLDLNANNAFSFHDPITDSIIVYGFWETNTYLVAFDLGFGNFSYEYYEEGNLITPPETFNFDIYIFDGWYADNGFNTLFNFSNTVSDNVTIYAKWIVDRNIYTISFEVENEVVAQIAVRKGFVASKPIIPAKEGYGLLGWYTDDSYSSMFNFNSEINSDLTLYGYYIEQSRIIKFTLSGGSYTVSFEYTYLIPLISFAIPDEKDGIPVSLINGSALSIASNLTYLKLPSNLTDISGATLNLASLLYISIANNTLFKTVDGILYSHDLQTLICYPQGLTNANYTIPNNVKRIKEYAFYNNKHLTTITIHASLEELDGLSFMNLSNLLAFTVLNNPYFVSLDGVLYTTNYQKLVKFPQNKKMSTYHVSANCYTIGDYAFANTDVANIILPNVLVIGKYSFINSSITHMEATKTSAILDYAFYNCINLESINLPNLEVLMKYAFAYCYSLNEASIPLVETIDTAAFISCYNLEYLLITNAIYINAQAFLNCSALRSITLTQIIEIKESSFEGATGLLDISFNYGVSQIENKAFKDASSLTEVVLPDSLTHLGSEAFFNCLSLMHVVLSNSLETIEYATFSYAGLTTIVLPNRIQTISNYAFNSTAITYIDIPGSVTVIGDMAFGFCIVLTTVQFRQNSNGLFVKIGLDVFTGYRQLSRIIVPNEDFYSRCLEDPNWASYIDLLTYE